MPGFDINSELTDIETGQMTFCTSILDSLDLQIAVINEAGEILYVNKAWIAFGNENGLDGMDWLRSNYLDVCRAEGIHDDPSMKDIAASIQAVIRGEMEKFEYEYPCHCPMEQRWFMMQMALLGGFSPRLFVISHLNITQRKLAEQAVASLSLHDPLTGLPNRRYFDQFLNAEWQRNMRDKTPVSLVIFDIDYFKSFNDTFGHLAGDKCLTAIASIIREVARRATDLAVRWGGEEFVLLLGNTPLDDAIKIAEETRLLVQRTQMADLGHCSVSAGVASFVPWDNHYDSLLALADEALYRAKAGGRNRVEAATMPAIKLA
ncbi:phytochrome-like protein cph2 [mine drainage metagenome]|uniref:Phytochrome-like protein cph2 n=1 Tax=mine drainage metagenome TaxID=410659 RepID=A0A1J5R9A5_9ZZZZ